VVHGRIQWLASVIAVRNFGFCESRKFLGQLSNYQFLKEDHAPSSAVFPIHMSHPAEQLSAFKEDPAPWSALFPTCIHSTSSATTKKLEKPKLSSTISR
jgi:hypothetical protein